MKCQIPQISWHSRDPVLSIDFQPIQSDQYRLASGGTDSHVLIWYVTYQENKSVKIECASDLYRHNKSVNTVRFSPNGEYLASGDDEGAIFVWQPKEREQVETPKDDENVNKEEWYPVKLLRGHLEDIYDISWSKDSNFLVSASMDNTAIMWDMQKYVKVHIFSDFKGYVQGVSWDPCNQYIASLGSDRTLRIHNINSKKTVCRISKAPWTNSTEKGNFKAKLFYDDTLKSYCRRLTYTPDGELLIVPSGIVEKGEKLLNTCYIFSKHSLSKPVVSLPTGDWYTTAVRCNPLLYKLRGAEIETLDKENESPKTMIDLPYRMIFAVAACDSVLMYDTEQLLPFACISNIHYTHLTDLAWSPDGLTLVASSTDGYCSFIVFTREELGEVYVCEEPKEIESEKIPEISNMEKKEVPEDTGTPLEKIPVEPNASIKAKDVTFQNTGDGSLTPSSKNVNALEKKLDKKSPKMASIKKFFVSPKTSVSTSPLVESSKAVEICDKDLSKIAEPEVIDLADTPVKGDKFSNSAFLEKAKTSGDNEAEPMDVDESNSVEKQRKCKVRLDFTEKVESETVPKIASAKPSPKASIKNFFKSPKLSVATRCNPQKVKSSVTDSAAKEAELSAVKEKSESATETIAPNLIENSELLISSSSKENPQNIQNQGIEFSFGKSKVSTVEKSDTKQKISSKIEPVIVIEETASDGDSTSTSMMDVKNVKENDWKLELSQDEDIVPMEIAADVPTKASEVAISPASKEPTKRRIALVTLSSKTTLKK